MRLIAELSMPSNSAWNGRWSGEDTKYTKVFTNSNAKKWREYIGSYRYDFGDGWCARVVIREAEHREKVTNKFCGYEWMISSIKVYKKIKC